MTTIADVEKLAFELPEPQRAALAAHLLESLPSVLQDDDDGIAEALARDAALDQDPASGISLEQLGALVARRRAWSAKLGPDLPRVRPPVGTSQHPDYRSGDLIPDQKREPAQNRAPDLAIHDWIDERRLRQARHHCVDLVTEV